MDNSIICECGNDKFWWFGELLRCPKCFNEYKRTGNGKEYWLRRFNKEENHYSENWEHFNYQNDQPDLIWPDGRILLKEAVDKYIANKESFQQINEEPENEYLRQCKRQGIDPSLYLMKRANKSSAEVARSIQDLIKNNCDCAIFNYEWRKFWLDHWLFEDRLKRISEFKEERSKYETHIINNP